MFELRQLECVNCGGKIDRSTMKCPYCDTQYERKQDEHIIKYEVERPGVHRIRAKVKLDQASIIHNPEAESNYVMGKLRSAIADSLLDYMQIAIADDPRSFTKEILGEVRVVDPNFNKQKEY